MISKKVSERSDKNGKYIESATIYATTREEALDFDASRLMQGSMLFVIQSASVYMLDSDGGVWYNISTGKAINDADEG